MLGVIQENSKPMCQFLLKVSLVIIVNQTSAHPQSTIEKLF